MQSIEGSRFDAWALVGWNAHPAIGYLHRKTHRAALRAHCQLKPVVWDGDAHPATGHLHPKTRGATLRARC